MHSYRKIIGVLLIFTLFVSFPYSVFSETDILSDVTFFGDSTTAHLALRGGIPKERVWSDITSTVLFKTVNKTKCVHLSKENKNLTLAEAAALKKPPILVITIGVSGGAGMLPRADFIEIYRELLLSVRKASPETKIFVQSILPLSDRSVKYYKRLTKDAVTEANEWIRGLCEELSIPYIDTHSLLINPQTGYLKTEYQNDEYMHLTAEAYTVLLKSVRDTIRANKHQ